MPNQDFCRQQIDSAWSRFSYELYKRTSWLARRVEHRSYVGDARWRRSFSLDIDTEHLRHIYDEHYISNLPEVNCELCLNKASCEQRIDSIIEEFNDTAIPLFLILPLIEIPKHKPFSDFDMRDRDGRSMHLLLQSHSALNVINTLRGALLEEHDDLITNKSNDFPELGENDLLTRILLELFQTEGLPEDIHGHIIEPKDINRLAKIVELVEYKIDAHYQELDAKLAELAGAAAEETPMVCLAYPRDPQTEIDKAREEARQTKAKDSRQFKAYIEQSPIFCFFLKTFSFMWLACVRFHLHYDEATILKGSFDITTDIIHDRTNRKPLPMAKGISLPFELDSIGIGEVDHVVIEAPDGLEFSPIDSKSIGFSDDGKPPLFGRDKDKLLKPFLVFYYQDYDLGIGAGLKPEAKASGTLTPGYAAIKAEKTWRDDLSGPHRRLPVDDSSSQKYWLLLNARPKLGLRSIGYLLFFLFSWLTFSICLVDPSSYGLGRDHDNSFSLSSLLLMASLVVMVVVNKAPEPYLLREAFIFPRRMSTLCAFLDIVGFVWLYLAGANASKNTIDFIALYSAKNPIIYWLPGFYGFFSSYATMITWICMIASFLMLVIMARWTFKHWWKKRWEEKPDAFYVFDVGFYERPEPEQK